jgi:hypothetical protein
MSVAFIVQKVSEKLLYFLQWPNFVKFSSYFGRKGLQQSGNSVSYCIKYHQPFHQPRSEVPKLLSHRLKKTPTFSSAQKQGAKLLSHCVSLIV